MTYALDTNIVSYILKGDKTVETNWLREERLGNNSVIPLVTYYEIKRGLLAVNSLTKLEAFEKICNVLTVSDLTIKDINTACFIYVELKKQKKIIEDADILIAAQAISRGHTLVTNNSKHFTGIKGLNITNWIEDSNHSQ